MACPVIVAYVATLDARMPEPMWADLCRYARLVQQSDANAGVQRLRAYIAADWAVHDATVSAMEVRGRDATALRQSPHIVDCETAVQAADLVASAALADDALYCAYAASMAAQLVLKTETLPFASDAAAYAYYLAAASTAGVHATAAWNGALDCLEAMLEVR